MLVTLFKSSSGEGGHNNDSKDDKFIQALRQANFTAQIIPVVAFEFCSLDILWRELQHPQHYDGNNSSPSSSSTFFFLNVLNVYIEKKFK